MDQSDDPRHNFYANPTIVELIKQQGKGPITDPTILLGDFWPEEEPVELFLAALHEWRGQKGPTGPHESGRCRYRRCFLSV